jgi:hypothetical protein
MDPTTVPPEESPAPGTRTVIDHAKRTSQVMTGVLMVVLGTIFLADQLGDAYGWRLSFRRLWPLLLIVAGLGMQFVHRDIEIIVTAGNGEVRREFRRRRESGNGGLFLMLVGVLLLAHMNRWLMLWDSWPLLIVAGGLSIMFSRGHDRSGKERS